MTMQILAFELDAPLYIYRWLKNNSTSLPSIPFIFKQETRYIITNL